MFEFKFPDVGEGIHEGTLIKWLVKVGDRVKEDDILAEVETDKAVVEIPSPVHGKITKLHAKAGEKIKVGSVIVTLETEQTEAKKEEPIIKKEKPKVCPPEKSGVALPKSLQGKISSGAEIRSAMQSIKSAPLSGRSPNELTSKVVQKSQETHRALATPHTRALARELKVNIEKLQGSGPLGRVTDDDIRRAAGHVVEESKEEQATKVSASDVYGPVSREAFVGIRKAIADKMSESIHHAVHVTHCDIADVTELVKVREKEKELALKRGVKLTYLPFITKAVIAALKKFPQLNASIDEEAQQIIYKEYYHMGMALATDAGLLVPIVKNADKKSILDIGREMHDLAERGRARKLKAEEMKGSSFTITNVGSIGGTVFTPIINYPEVAILGVGRMRDEIRVIEGKAQQRKILYLSLSFDHRIADGAVAAAFMNEIIAHLEDPDLLLIDVI